MGDYIVQADLEKLLSVDIVIQLTDDTGAGVVDQDNLNEVIAGSEGEANGYLQTKYTVPISPVPPGLKVAVADIAAYRLHLRRPGAVTDQVDRQYKNAVDFLKNVSKGLASLGDEAAAPEDTSHAVDFTSDTRKFTDESMESF